MRLSGCRPPADAEVPDDGNQRARRKQLGQRRPWAWHARQADAKVAERDYAEEAVDR